MAEIWGLVYLPVKGYLLVCDAVRRFWTAKSAYKPSRQDILRTRGRARCIQVACLGCLAVYVHLC